jgi:twitching motility protein PilT
MINQLLQFIVENKGSDLHISTGLKPLVRIDGDIEQIETETITPELAEQMAREITDDQQFNTFLETQDFDFSYQLGEVARFRVNLFMQSRGVGMVCRTIPTKILTLDELGCPPIFRQISRQPRGVVLVTGPTGSGKSTTLAAMIHEINHTEKAHILTVEDPIEFVHQPALSLINQREVGAHTHSFTSALRSALREDPDIILVGEMRDLETIRLALTAAETGHLVFGTLHTSSAAKTMDRIIDVFPAAEKDMVRAMLSESLRSVISQALLKKSGGGRVAAHEIMIATPAIKNLIRENKVAQMYSIIQTGQHLGMQTLDQCLIKMVLDQKIDLEEALVKAVNKEDMKKACSGAGGGAAAQAQAAPEQMKKRA